MGLGLENMSGYFNSLDHLEKLNTTKKELESSVSKKLTEDKGEMISYFQNQNGYSYLVSCQTKVKDDEFYTINSFLLPEFSEPKRTIKNVGNANCNADILRFYGLNKHLLTIKAQKP